MKCICHVEDIVRDYSKVPAVKKCVELQHNDGLDFGRGLSLHGQCSEALQLLQQMQQEGPKPNNRTWTAILAGYCQRGQDKDASQLFHQMSYEGLEHNVVTWNALISGFVSHGQNHEALNTYFQMIHEGGVPDEVTYICILKACANVVDFCLGRLIHGQLINDEKHGLMLQTTLIDMYSKCGCLEDAETLFQGLSIRDVVVYNSLIAGYTLHGFLKNALLLFQTMLKERVMLDTTTLLNIIQVCSLMVASICGKLTHSIIIEDGAEKSEFLSTSLIDMYVQCGNFHDAWRVFNNSSKSDISCWNALIAGYTLYTDFASVHQMLEQMRKRGLNPDSATFTCLLSACSSIGLVEMGSCLMNSMEEKYGISPAHEHFGCMVHLLGDSGCLIEAEDLMYSMPIKPKLVPWSSLLNSCRLHNEVDLAEHCFQNIIDIDECCSSAFALMSNIYSSVNMANKVNKMNFMQQHFNAWKIPGKAHIELDGLVSEFVVADNTHPDSDAIYAKLAYMATKLKLEGYISSI